MSKRTWWSGWDITGLALAALIPVMHWYGHDETMRTASLLLILHWGMRNET